MDKETLIEAMTNELNRVYGHWSHEFENEEVIQVMANAVLSLLQWKDVADGLPEVRGIYVVIGEYSLSPYLLEYPYDLSNKWEKTVAAYIPYPIPPYKEQR